MKENPQIPGSAGNEGLGAPSPGRDLGKGWERFWTCPEMAFPVGAWKSAPVNTALGFILINYSPFKVLCIVTFSRCVVLWSRGMV